MEQGEKNRIIKEARERLRVGTECSNRNLDCNCEFTIASSIFEWSTRNPNSLLVSGTSVIGNNSYFTVYKDGVWCTIIKNTFDKELEIVREIINKD